jgi:hypothetical protein
LFSSLQGYYLLHPGLRQSGRVRASFSLNLLTKEKTMNKIIKESHHE